jgi:hypothetical protein
VTTASWASFIRPQPRELRASTIEAQMRLVSVMWLCTSRNFAAKVVATGLSWPSTVLFADSDRGARRARQVRE